MNAARPAERTPGPADLAWYLLGVCGLAACLTLIFLGMRAVMDIGGSCADGGPYVPVQRCPEGVGAAMALAFPGLFLFGVIMLVRGASLGGGFAAATAFAWPALFLSLGWNFLEFAFRRPGGGVEMGWLICGALFVLMGGLPLLGLVAALRPARRRGRPPAIVRSAEGGTPPAEARGGAGGVPPRPLRRRLAATGPVRRAELERLGAGLRTLASARSGPALADFDDLIGRLERLAALHEQGHLTDEEFGLAKRRLFAGGTEGG